jgi:hypothetical protein
MVHGQFPAHISLRHPAIPATQGVALSNRLQFWVRHGASVANTEELARPRVQVGFQNANTRVEFRLLDA